MEKLNLPDKIHAGDTIKIVDDISRYPAGDGWTLSYVLVTSANIYTTSSTADGDAHATTVAASATADWVAARYKWAAYALKDSERYTVATGSIQVLPDLTAGATDQRNHVEKVLEAIEAVLENKATSDAYSVEIAGKTLQRYKPEELLVWRDKYKAELRQLKSEERLANGLGSGNRVNIRFRG